VTNHPAMMAATNMMERTSQSSIGPHEFQVPSPATLANRAPTFVGNPANRAPTFVGNP
jgi:hypothetical protein